MTSFPKPFALSLEINEAFRWEISSSYEKSAAFRIIETSSFGACKVASGEFYDIFPKHFALSLEINEAFRREISSSYEKSAANLPLSV